MKKAIPLFTVMIGAMMGLYHCAADTATAPSEAPATTQSVAYTTTEEPPATATGDLTLRTGLDHSVFLLDSSTRKGYYYVEAKAGKAATLDAQRTPLNLSIVIDRSGSMDGEKLRYAKEAAEFVVGQLTEEDYLSVVIYDDYVQVVSPAGHVTDKEALRKQIRSIRSAGSTHLHGGMMEGYAQVKRNHQSGYVNRVLLLSDGLANVGITSQDELQRIAKAQNLEHGISISTFGIGADFNEDLMTGLADYGSGNYYFIAEPNAIPGIFQKELKGLLAVVAQNTMLTVELPEGVQLDHLFGYKYEQSGNRVVVHFRDIFSEETKAIMLRFAINDARRAPFRFRATLTYNQANTPEKAAGKLEKLDVLSLAENLAQWQESESEDVMAQAVLFEANDRLERAMREVDKGNYDLAREVTQENEVYLNSNTKYVSKSKELQTQQSTNSTYYDQIKHAETMKEADMKMMQKSSKSLNYDVRKKK